MFGGIEVISPSPSHSSSRRELAFHAHDRAYVALNNIWSRQTPVLLRMCEVGHNGRKMLLDVFCFNASQPFLAFFE